MHAIQGQYLNAVLHHEKIGYSNIHANKNKMDQFTADIKDIAALMQAINNQKSDKTNQNKAEKDITINLNDSPKHIALVQRVKESMKDEPEAAAALYDNCIWKGSEISNVLSTLQKSYQFKSDEIRMIYPELEQTLKNLNILIEMAAQGEKNAERAIQAILDNMRKLMG